MKPLVRIYREAFSGLSRELWILAFVAFVNRSGTMVLPFISLYLTSERGLAPKEAGQLVGLYGLGSVAGAYLGGFVSDRLGAVRALEASLLGGGLGFLLLSTLRDRWAVAFGLFLVGMIVESFRPALMTAVSEHADPKNKAQAFAFLRLALNLGVGFGPAIGGFLAVISYRWLFYADAFTCWLAAALLMKSSLRRRVALEAVEETRAPARSPFRDRFFLALLLLVVATASVLFQVFSTLPLYLGQHVGWRENAIGLLLSLNAFLIVAFEMVLIHSLRNRDRLRLVGFGAFLLAGGFALMPLGSSAVWLAFTVVVWTFGEMVVLPILNVVVAERAPAGLQGRYMGLYTMAFAIAFIVAPVAGTYVYEHFGADRLWYSVGVVGIALWLFALQLRRQSMPSRS